MSHTKGPWEFIGIDNGDAVIAATVHGKRRAVAHAYGLVNWNNTDEEVRNANALLIAAAPDLLQELKNIVNADYRHWEEGSNTAEEFVLWAKNRARHAIAKAEGVK